MRIVTRTALIAALAAAMPMAARAEAPAPTLNLSAEGSVTAVPDTATVTLGVVEQADTAGAALEANNAAMRKTFESLGAAGIADRDMATSNFTIEPVTVYPQARDDGTQDPPRVVGYRVSNLVTVKIRDVTQTGGLLDKVVRVGANQVQGIAFGRADEDALLDRARADAMRAAAAKAKIYAEAGGFELVRILSVSESGGAMPYAAPAMMAKRAAEDVPIAAGEQELQVTVNVSWEIRPKP